MPYADQDRKRNAASADARRHDESVREIGPPPAIVNPDRRESCKYDLRRYLLTYHESAFPLKFSPDHDLLIEHTQRVMLEGGQMVAIYPRGSGKTTIFQRGEIWAAVYGHRRFPMLLCADDLKFRQLLKGIKTVLENNELLLEDFPEVIHPIRQLERIANRANFQMCRGEPTYMRWGIEQIVFATTEESKKRGNAGVVIGGGGLTGAAVRGGVVTLPTGEQVRPDAVLIDDPQTRKSAKSESQNQEREDIINGDILGMAGPGKSIAAMVAATVIYQSDLASRLLDRERSPAWTPLKVSMIKNWPTKMELWEKYNAILRQELLDELDKGSANAFYAKNRDAMDAGAQVYWEERVLPGRLSALQSAMDEYFKDPRSFMAEKQNSPEESLKGDLAKLDPLSIVARTGPFGRRVVPPDVSVITAHIDVQQKLLFWMVCGWTQHAGGYVLDYGTTPKQTRRHFILRDIKKDLTANYPGLDESGALRQAICDTISGLTETRWLRTDGAEMRIDRGLVDARYKTDAVEAGIQLAKQSQFMPCYGVGIRARDAPMALWTKKRGVRRGHNWTMQKPDRRLLLSVFYDTNYWKTEVHQGLLIPSAHTQAINLYSEARSHHQMLADQLCSERAVRCEAKGRIVDEWELPSNRPDNHYWDNLVACAVAASLCGVKKEMESGKEGPAKKSIPKKNRVKQLRM